MKMLEPTYIQFIKGVEYALRVAWHRQHGVFAEKVEISEPFLSEILNKKKKASYETQIKLSKIIGLPYEEIVKLGSTNTNKPSFDKTYYNQIILDNYNLIMKSIGSKDYGGATLQGMMDSIKNPEIKKTENETYQGAFDNLRAIFASNDQGLIDAILSNLREFKRASEALKKQANEFELLRNEINEIKQKIKNPSGPSKDTEEPLMNNNAK